MVDLIDLVSISRRRCLAPAHLTLLGAEVVLTTALVFTLTVGTVAYTNRKTSSIKPLLSESEPLYLSPYIKAGHLGLARKLSRVGPIPFASAHAPPRKSYSGFITVDEYPRESHLFFWFFPALNKPKTAPVLLWLDGGPGYSNLVSVFHQNGPYSYLQGQGEGASAGRVEASSEDSDWTQDYSMIYVDNPVGTGFSHGPSFLTTCEENAEHLLSFLLQFRALFPAHATSTTPLYLVGESYGGHIGPVLGALLLRDPRAADIALNLAGILLFAPWISPAIQASYNANYMYQLGLIDSHTHAAIGLEQDRALALIRAGRYAEARNAWFGVIAGPNSVFAKASGFMCAYNAMKGGVDAVVHSAFGPEFEAYLNSTEFRTAVHAGAGSSARVTPFVTISQGVMAAMAGEIMRSKTGDLESILAADPHLQVVIVAGQLDTTVIHVGVEAVLDALDWAGKDEWAKSRRSIWRLSPFDGIPAGYFRSARNLNYVLLRNAGHLLIADAPQLALRIVQDFIPRLF